MALDWEKYSAYAPLVLRVGLALVVLWFGVSQLISPSDWLGYLPSFVFKLPFSPESFILFNGVFEIIFGGLLLTGFWVRPAAALLSLHLLGIIITLGYNEIAVRDFGLLLAMISVFLSGKDARCWGK
jgi:uncharacterized membrane protein YphA (DoxX/SURF4 family)